MSNALAEHTSWEKGSITKHRGLTENQLPLSLLAEFGPVAESLCSLFGLWQEAESAIPRDYFKETKSSNISGDSI